MQQILDILSSLGFNWHVALANFINFLIILFLLNKFFFGKIGKTIKTRQDIIQRGLSDARDAENALSSAEEEKKNIIKEAQKEGLTIVNKAEINAQAIASDITKEAEIKADEHLKSIALKEQNIKESVEKEFAERAPSIVAKMYEKTLEKEMTSKDNDAMIARMNA